MRKEYFENLPENKDVIVIEDPDGDINLGIRSEKPLTPQDEIPVTRPSFFQRMRSTINTLREDGRQRFVQLVWGIKRKKHVIIKEENIKRKVPKKRGKKQRRNKSYYNFKNDSA